MKQSGGGSGGRRWEGTARIMYSVIPIRIAVEAPISRAFSQPIIFDCIPRRASWNLGGVHLKASFSLYFLFSISFFYLLVYRCSVTMASMRLASRRLPLARKLVPAIESPLQRRFSTQTVKSKVGGSEAIWYIYGNVNNANIYRMLCPTPTRQPIRRQRPWLMNALPSWCLPMSVRFL